MALTGGSVWEVPRPAKPTSKSGWADKTRLKLSVTSTTTASGSLEGL